MNNTDISNIITDVLEKLTVDFDDVEVVQGDINTAFVIHTKEGGVLIGTNGEGLDALSYIIRRMVQKRNTDDDKKMFIVDVNNYQTKKTEAFIQTVKVSADKVRLFKQNIELSPMSSYERMIVHSTFSSDPEIETISEGEGKFRRVVLRYV